MIERKTIVHRGVGLHARPASELAKRAATATGQVWLSRPGGPKVDARSLLQIITLAISNGDEIMLSANDPTDEATIDKMVEIVSRDDA